MKTEIKFLFAIFLAVTFSSCGGDDTHKPYGSEDGGIPDAIEVLSYDAIPGGVHIKYVPPKNNNLLYVKAKYVLDTGKKMEARASVYANVVTIEGFGNTSVKKISLSAVNRLEGEGKTTEIEVVPGTPPCVLAYNSLTTNTTFGGISVNIDNENKSLIFIDVDTQDASGQWYTAYTEYTSMKDVAFAVRGFKAEEREFKIVVRDNWNNKSETFSTILEPLYEEQLDLTKFKAVKLPNDMKMDAYGSIEHLFNGKNKWGEFNLAHSPDFDEFPVWFTFDMGIKARLSRYKYWQRLDGDGLYLYDHGNPKTWEIWGCADTPDPSGGWDGWVKLMDCESIKPSGWPVGARSDEDIAYAKRGEEFEFPMDSPPVRYIRFKATSTWSDRGLLHIQQLWFWGQTAE